MINNLIQAYRAEFFDLSPSDFWRIIKSKWAILLVPAVVFVLIGILLAVSLRCKLPILMFCAIVIEFFFCITADRYIVKQYQGSLHSEAAHLERVKIFLETVYPNHSLYSAATIDTLIDRLSGHIQKLHPFKSLTRRLISFAKAIIFPAITYIAGAYSSSLKQFDFASVVGFAVAIIIILAMMYITGLFVCNALGKIIYRDYDAAIALCEDLKDIKLIYFSSDNVSSQE